MRVLTEREQTLYELFMKANPSIPERHLFYLKTMLAHMSGTFGLKPTGKCANCGKEIKSEKPRVFCETGYTDTKCVFEWIDKHPEALVEMITS
jgi:hypothetical protein